MYSHVLGQKLISTRPLVQEIKDEAGMRKYHSVDLNDISRHQLEGAFRNEESVRSPRSARFSNYVIKQKNNLRLLLLVGGTSEICVF